MLLLVLSVCALERVAERRGEPGAPGTGPGFALALRCGGASSSVTVFFSGCRRPAMRG